MKCRIKFVCETVKWFDKVNGNTYHSNRITRCSDGKTIVTPFTYGYGTHYQTTAVGTMLNAGWLPKRYNKDTMFLYERENNYPVHWIVSGGLKRECIANGTL